MGRAIIALLVVGMIAVGVVEGMGPVLSSQASSCTVTLTPDRTIQNAVDDASPGDTVCLEIGTWKESITIDKGLTLMGIGSKPATIKAAPSEQSEEASKPVVTIRGDRVGHVVLESLRLVESQGQAVPSPAGIRGIASHVSVDVIDSTIAKNAFGVSAVGTDASYDFQNAQISMNEIAVQVTDVNINFTNSTVSNNREGVQLSRAAQARFENATVTDNDVYGIIAQDTSQVGLTKTRITRNKRLGGLILGVTLREANLKSQASAQVDESTFNGNINGILLGIRAEMTIASSAITKNTRWGLASTLKTCNISQLPQAPRGQFEGNVTFEGGNTIRDNNTSGNLDGKGNPGDHPFTESPDGQVCLPSGKNE